MREPSLMGLGLGLGVRFQASAGTGIHWDSNSGIRGLGLCVVGFGAKFGVRGKYWGVGIFVLWKLRTLASVHNCVSFGPSAFNPSVSQSTSFAAVCVPPITDFDNCV